MTDLLNGLTESDEELLLIIDEIMKQSITNCLAFTIMAQSG